MVLLSTKMCALCSAQTELKWETCKHVNSYSHITHLQTTESRLNLILLIQCVIGFLFSQARFNFLNGQKWSSFSFYIIMRPPFLLPPVSALEFRTIWDEVTMILHKGDMYVLERKKNTDHFSGPIYLHAIAHHSHLQCRQDGTRYQPIGCVHHWGLLGPDIICTPWMDFGSSWVSAVLGRKKRCMSTCVHSWAKFESTDMYAWILGRDTVVELEMS